MMKCQHTSASYLDSCGKLAKEMIKSGPNGKPSTIDGQAVCETHARFWRVRAFVTVALEE
jgi:hypothetical protein